MKARVTKSLILAFTLGIAFSSCKKEELEPVPVPTPTTPVQNTYTVPTTYNFTNVNYGGQTSRLNMLGEMVTYMKTGNTSGTILSAQKLKDMYANQNSQFTDAALNTSGKQIKSKVFSLDQTIFDAYMDSIEMASQSSGSGSNGVAGVVVSSADPSKKYLMNERGMEYTQLIEKGLMGALIYYQITEVYLGESQIGSGVDNTTVVAGEGTAMEHHWDEAFGYFGIPVDFPTNVTGIRYWGKYTSSRDALLGCNAKLMNAFLKGRTAISYKDMTAKDQQVTIIRDELEKVCAATIISYINSAKANFADDAQRNHSLSEAIGFVKAFKYNPTKKITTVQIDQVLNYIGSNLYNVTTVNLDSAKDLISSIYGLDSIKNTL